MGQEIDRSYFTPQDFETFGERLRRETALLESWFRERRFAVDPSIGGFELEAWLIDNAGCPAPVNQRYLQRLADPLVVPELAAFNVEFNTPERVLQGAALSELQSALDTLWTRCDRQAAELGANLVMIGILPTVREQELTLANMSPLERYRALNDQVMRLRRGRPLRLEIQARDSLHTEHDNIMLEAAATSFQIHLQVKEAEAVGFFNSAVIVSAPMVAATANSPYLFGRELWEETRIPLFEQAVAVGADSADSGDSGDTKRAYRRVTFGSGYLRASLLEVYRENLEHYPPLLPEWLEVASDQLHHVRLHNGTIWRWNRPLIGFNRSGQPHLRIEHRVVPAGPGVADTIANAALFYGLVHALARSMAAPEARLPFAQSRENFYAAARHGLNANIVWLDGARGSIRSLLLDTLLPLARRGLEMLDIHKTDIDHYLGIIEARVAGGRTGAAWQRAFVERHGRDMQALTTAYLKGQRSGRPVHEWALG